MGRHRAGAAGIATSAGPIVTDAEHQTEGEMFVADITEVAITGLDQEATKLVIESWTPAHGLTVVERD